MSNAHIALENYRKVKSTIWLSLSSERKKYKNKKRTAYSLPYSYKVKK